MLPVLFRIGPLELRSWGVFVLVAFVVGIIYVSNKAKKHGVNPERIWDLGFWVALSAIIGSRLFYIFYHLPYFKEHPSEMIKFWEGGAVFFGGFIFGLFAGVVYLLKHRREIPFWKIGDFSAEALALGMFFGRWGCFFNGCCFGKESNLPWSVVFPPESPAYEVMDSLHIHPSQLYEGFLNLIIFFLLILIERRKPFDGFIFLFYLMVASLVRFLVDFTRYYEPENVVILTINQWISIGVFIISGTILVYLMLKGRKSTR